MIYMKLPGIAQSLRSILIKNFLGSGFPIFDPKTLPFASYGLFDALLF